MNLNTVSLTWGCDPELFFTKDGKVVPSTKVIKKTDEKTVATDGFQFELHPKTDSNYCRQLAARRIWWALRDAADIARREGVNIATDVGFVIDDKTFKSLPPTERRFGCNPTNNVYESGGRRPTGVRIRLRTGGGHIHLGLPERYRSREHVEKLVRVFDIVVGNNLVFFDQSEASTARRKYYGRAGEYRLKRYGLEYRVPSNFWMRSYLLWSMVTGLMRNSVELYNTNLYDKLIKEFDSQKVRDAINLNSPELAMENLLILKKFIKKNEIRSYSGLDMYTIDAFVKIARSGNIKGMDNNFNDMFDDWLSHGEYGSAGFEVLLEQS